MISPIESQPANPSTSDQRVSWLVNFFMPATSHNKPHIFSLLRVLSLASLFVSVRSQLFPAQLELSSLSGITGFTLNGGQGGDQAGFSVSSAGDVNDDGVSDLLIGAPDTDLATGLVHGKTYVVFGTPDLGARSILELASLNGTSGFILNGDKAGDRSGSSVSSAGDVNSDGVADLLIGARGADPATGRENAGKTYVVFGKRGLGAGGTVELSALDGTNGFVLNGEQSLDGSGRSVSNAGDVNDDGVADFVIGAVGVDPAPGRENAGRTYVVFGKPGLGASGTIELSSLNGANGFALNGDLRLDNSGCSVSSAGDVNDDGVADLVIGAYNAAPRFGRTAAGKSYVVFGKRGLGTGGTLELSSLDGTSGFTINGDQTNDYSGYSVSSAGDVNCDGVADLLIGARSATPAAGREGAGRSYVVFGKRSLGTGGMLELSSLDGTNGFTISGDKAGDVSGDSVSIAGDVNHDGGMDFLIGAWLADPASGREGAGKTYVVFGKPGLGANGTLELSSLDSHNGFSLNGDQAKDHSGFSVANAGDVNGDGVADLVIGAPYDSAAIREPVAGKTYVVFGRRPGTSFPSSISPQASATMTSFSPSSTSKRGTTDAAFPLSTSPPTTTQLDFTMPSSALLPTTISTEIPQSSPSFVTTGVDSTTPSSAALSPSTISVGVPQPGSSPMTKQLESTIPSSAVLSLSTISAGILQSDPSPMTTQLDSTTTGRLLSTLTTSGERSTAASIDSFEPPSLGFPLGIAGGICAVVSSVAAALLALRRRRQTLLPDPEQSPQNPTSEYIAIDSLGLPSPEPIYDDLHLHPKGHSHYVGDKELQVFNREQAQHESAKAATTSGYANLPSRQPTSEHDEYESARLAPEQANDDDNSK